VYSELLNVKTYTFIFMALCFTNISLSLRCRVEFLLRELFLISKLVWFVQRKRLLDIQAHPGSMKEELSSLQFIGVSFSSKRYLYRYVLVSVKT